MRRVAAAVGVVFAVVALIVGCQSATGRRVVVTPRMDDAEITALVKTRLVADGAANLTRVDVDTNQGVVSLNGSVHTASEKTYAERLARGTEGVKAVVDNLQIARKQ
jgi:hyperosmotically inducible protein